MGIITVKNCVVLMLIIMLVVTEVESIAPSQEIATAPTKFPEPPCNVKCMRKCKVYSDHIVFDYCMGDCISGCPGSPTV